MNLKEATFSAGRWSGGSAGFVALVHALQLFALARLLEPGDFGQMAVASSALAIIALIADLGLSQAVIRYRSVPSNHLASLFTINVSGSILLMAGLVIAAPFIGDAYSSKVLTSLLQMVSLTIPVLALGQQARALAARELRFDKLAIVDVIAATTGCVIAICAALLGFGVFSLASAVVASSLTSTTLSLALLDTERPRWRFKPSEVRPYLGYGAYLVGDRLTNTAVRESDVFVSSLVLGPSAVGIYSVPRDLCLRASTAINSAMVKIGFPVMSQVGDDQDRLRSIYLQALRMGASINAPIFIAVALYADQIVLLFFGNQWQGSGIYLRVLAIWGMIRSTGNPVGSLLYSTGRTKQAFLWNLSLLITLPAIYWLVVSEAGLLGLALSVTGLQIALALPTWKFLVKPACNAGFIDYSKQILTPTSISLASSIPGYAATWVVTGALAKVIVGGFAFASAYLALSWLFNRQWVRGFRKVLDLRGRIA